MDKKKILFVLTQSHWGGAQKYVKELSESLSEDFEVVVATGTAFGLQTSDYSLSRLARRGLRSSQIELQYLQRAISPIKDIMAIFELRKLYKNLKPDIVHLNSSKAGIIGSIAGGLLTVVCRPSTVYTAHGWVFDEPLSKARKWLYRILEKYTARFKDAIIVLSQKDKNTAKSILRVPESKLKLIKNGINTDIEYLDHNKARELLGLPMNAYVIGTIANHYKTKGLDVLIDAFAEINENIPNARLCLIGSGPLTSDFRLQLVPTRASGTSDFGLKDRIVFAGHKENASRYLKAFDLFVLPSRKEGLPYTLLEAMLAELPIIATRVGGIPELIENKKNGLLVEPENRTELAEAIIWARKNQPLMQKMATHGLSEVKDNFSLEKMISRTRSVYLELLN